MKPLSILSAAALLWVFAATAAAQKGNDDERARSHFEAGTSYFQESRFDDAVREFQEAYRLSGRNVLLINIGLSYGHALKFDEAIATYQEYLDKEPQAAERKDIEARIEHLRKMAQQVRDAKKESATAPPATAPESEPQQKPEPQPAAENAEPKEAPAQQDQGGSVLPWVIGGVGAALIVGGTVTGILTLSAQSDLDDSCLESRECFSKEGDKIDSAKAMALTTDILLGTGIAALITGTVLLFVLDGGEPAEAEPQTAIACTADGCLGVARVRF